MTATGLDEGFEYSAIANPDPGLIKNAIEWLVQDKGFTQSDAQGLFDSGLQFIRVGLVMVATRPQGGGLLAGSIFISAAELKIYEAIIADAALDRNAAHAALVTNSVAADVLDGRRVIMVPHSQGNQYANMTYNDPLLQSFHNVLSIASVANATRRVAVAGSVGANRDDDQILNGARLIDPRIEGPTIFGAGKPKDLSGHGFIESYLDNTKAAGKVQLNLQKALGETTDPSTGRVLATTSGGFTGPQAQTETLDIGRNGVTFTVSYNAYTIPDRFDVIYRNKRIASTGGLVSDTGTLTVKLPRDNNNPRDGLIVIAVYGPDPGTAWDYTVNCPQ